MDFILVCKPTSHPELSEGVEFLQRGGAVRTVVRRRWTGQRREDEGRPFGVGFQEQAPNHSKPLRSRAVGGEHWSQSVGDVPRAGMGEARRTQVNPRGRVVNQRLVVETRGVSISWDKARRRPGVLGGRRPAYRGRDPDSGSRVELREPVAPMPREKLKWQPPRGERDPRGALGRTDP